MNEKTKEAIEGVIYRVRNRKDGTPAWALAKICALVEAEKPTREELLCQLDAWHSVFGTSQLSYASARLEAAESENKRLKFKAEGEGEVVILDGMIPFRDFDVKINHLCGKKGRIIFQPEGESK